MFGFFAATEGIKGEEPSVANSDTWEELFSILMFHYHMSKQEICDCSLPFIFSLVEKARRRLCESLGVQYNDDEVSEDEAPFDEAYPIEGNPKIRRTDNSTIVDKQAKSSTKNRYMASSKSDVIDFFGGFAAIEDKG